MNMDNTSVLVTGGASGLGLATVRRCLERGAEVVAFDLKSEGAPAPRHHPFAGDVRDEGDVVAAIERASELAPLRLVVNCAGVGVSVRTVGRQGKLPLADFRRTIEINLVGTFNVVSSAAVAMAENELRGDERGVIINTASAAAFDGQVGQVPYAASKAGVVGMTLPLARDLARIGVRVVTIAPGLFETPLMAGLDDVQKRALVSSTPHPARLGHPDEFASMVEAIAMNPFLNGETIRLDGGTRLGFTA